jgi:hypothetical protein
MSFGHRPSLLTVVRQWVRRGVIAKTRFINRSGLFSLPSPKLFFCLPMVRRYNQLEGELFMDTVVTIELPRYVVNASA